MNDYGNGVPRLEQRTRCHLLIDCLCGGDQPATRESERSDVATKIRSHHSKRKVMDDSRFSTYSDREIRSANALRPQGRRTIPVLSARATSLYVSMIQIHQEGSHLFTIQRHRDQGETVGVALYEVRGSIDPGVLTAQRCLGHLIDD